MSEYLRDLNHLTSSPTEFEIPSVMIYQFRLPEGAEEETVATIQNEGPIAERVQPISQIAPILSKMLKLLLKFHRTTPGGQGIELVVLGETEFWFHPFQNPLIWILQKLVRNLPQQPLPSTSRRKW